MQSYLGPGQRVVDSLHKALDGGYDAAQCACSDLQPSLWYAYLYNPPCPITVAQTKLVPFGAAVAWLF